MPYQPPPLPNVELLPIDDAELCRRYELLYTGVVNDILRDEQLLYQALPPSIMPLERDMRVAGIVFTVKGMKTLTVEGEMEQRAQMLEAIHADSVVVWDTGEDDTSAQWGEVMTKAAIRAGCRGAVIDGGVRDTQLVLDQQFPVWCRYRTSNAMLGRFRMVGYQVPIRIGGVDIHAGDIVFADIDGAVIVPRRLAMTVLERAEALRRDEQEYKRWIDEGMSATEVVKKGGAF
ncbi:RraA family protein [Phycisphaerales bacterium AB-hyl4]|uniref:RraA family protein n=1 Tax=Natronomicrosphaera hydrolytica TaxID=3242702 RepID=A0ABV4UCJ6_9BACT